MKPQTKMVLRHLREHGSITSREALRAYGCDRLAARVWEVRQAGYRVEKTMEAQQDGAHFARYFLARKRRRAK